MVLPEYQSAKTVVFYLDVRSEVRTRHSLQDALASGKKIVVPYCIEGNELELFHLESLDELSTGMYRILEPKVELRDVPAKRVDVIDVDLIMVPGVAFDRAAAGPATARVTTTGCSKTPDRIRHSSP